MAVKAFKVNDVDRIFVNEAGAGGGSLPISDSGIPIGVAQILNFTGDVVVTVNGGDPNQIDVDIGPGLTLTEAYDSATMPSDNVLNLTVARGPLVARDDVVSIGEALIEARNNAGTHRFFIHDNPDTNLAGPGGGGYRVTGALNLGSNPGISWNQAGLVLDNDGAVVVGPGVNYQASPGILFSAKGNLAGVASDYRWAIHTEAQGPAANAPDVALGLSTSISTNPTSRDDTPQRICDLLTDQAQDSLRWEVYTDLSVHTASTMSLNAETIAAGTFANTNQLLFRAGHALGSGAILTLSTPSTSVVMDEATQIITVTAGANINVISSAAIGLNTGSSANLVLDTAGDSATMGGNVVQISGGDSFVAAANNGVRLTLNGSGGSAELANDTDATSVVLSGGGITITGRVFTTITGSAISLSGGDITLDPSGGSTFLATVGSKLSFFGAGAATQQSVAALTNSVTAGGTDDVIANYTSLVVYATDAAAIRNDIYQLARKVAQIQAAIATYGLFV